MSSIREQIAAWPEMPKTPTRKSNLEWHVYWIHRREAEAARLATATEALRALVNSGACDGHAGNQGLDRTGCHICDAAWDARAVLDALK